MFLSEGPQEDVSKVKMLCVFKDFQSTALAVPALSFLILKEQFL